MTSSPFVNILEPLLIAVGAVFFTISYYSLYVLPKLNCNTGKCDCKPNEKEVRSLKVNKAVFWFGLILSIGFLSYFEYSKYGAASNVDVCAKECSTNTTNSCNSSCEEGSGETITENDDTLQNSIEPLTQSEITCPKCGQKKVETLPTDICLISYTCEKCQIVLHPKDGDCCVFCTYGNHKCPSKQ